VLIRTYVRREAGGVRSPPGKASPLTGLSKLAYPLQVFKQGRRFYPSEHVMILRPVLDIELGSNRAANGAYALIDEYAVRRRPDCFSDPRVQQANSARGGLVGLRHIPVAGCTQVASLKR
jgi:cytochrome P450